LIALGPHISTKYPESQSLRKSIFKAAVEEKDMPYSLIPDTFKSYSRNHHADEEGTLSLFV
jgi:hypothetical protein